MLLRRMLIGAWVAALSSCDSGVPKMSSTGDSTGESTTLAGSCTFMADGHCDDYAEPQADANTAKACNDMGGAWASHQCALDGRAAVCSESGPATRTYAYGTAAATALMSSCPVGKLTLLEGACDMPMHGTCDEYIGTQTAAGYGGAAATAGDAAVRCATDKGTWTPGGHCAMEARAASCAPNAPATSTYAYNAMAADKLAMTCAKEDFKRLIAAPPPMMTDEDAGL